MSTGVKSINIFTELDRLKVQWVAAGEDEIKICCPVHEDSTPSASLNTKEHLWKCYVPSCGASGDFVSLLAYIVKQERRLVLADLQARYPDIAGVSEIPTNTVEKFHKKLHEAGPLLNELRKRGLTDEMMRDARLGFHDGRITIPVYSQTGQCVNVRRYLPGAPGPQKMRNTSGHGSPALYRADRLGNAAEVLVCGGEMKALVAGTLLADKGIAAVCSTGGEGHWLNEWTTLLSSRKVYICMDVDEPGIAAARNMALEMFGKVKSVHVVKLPLDRAQFPKGDINDWVGQLHATANDLYELLKATPEWSPPTKLSLPKGEVKQLELAEAITHGTVGQLIEVKAVVAAADQTPFLVPKEVDIECSRDQAGCIVCPVRQLPQGDSGWTRMDISASSPSVLGMVGATEREHPIRISEALGIPPCKAVRFHARTHHIVHDVRLAAPMDIAGTRIGDAWYPAMVVAKQVSDLNVACRMRGSVHPHPRTQQAVALISESEEVEDSLSRYAPSSTDIEALSRLFKPDAPGLEPLRSRLNAIYADLETNVTWIYRRREMHLAYDLAWHSPLLLNFGGRQVNGWINLLMLGDSSQGKSECVLRLMKHYGCGDKVDCKNATVAGLLGGLEQLGNRWFVRWGAIPAHDRGLAIMEELKGLSTEVLSRLTEMRSSGIAEIPKIERRKALARTRLIMVSNPRTPRPVASFHYGIEAIHELIGALEDVRRFDLAMIVAKGEVSDEVINMAPSARPKVEHRATADMCKKLVLWAWTRKPEQVVFDASAVDAVVETSISLCKKFSEAVPLVDQGSIRLKVARLSAALAARTFSSPDGFQLLVTKTHVEFIGSFIDKLYSSSAMGYADFSEAQRAMSEIQDPKVVEKALRNTKFPADLASVMLRRDTVSLEDMMSATSTDMDTARLLLSLLVRKGALIRISKSEYAKNPQLIAILKDVQATAKGKNQHDTAGDEF